MTAWVRALARLWRAHMRARVRHPVRVHYLDMALPRLFAAPQWPKGMQVKRWAQPQPDFYRRLYDEVGRQWHWVSRRYWSDRKLAAELAPPATEIFVLWHKSRPIGFVELNWRLHPTAEIVFLGLVGDAIGSGLGAALLRFALRHIVAKGASMVRIQTCSLDHPRALALYQEVGFRIRRAANNEIWDEF